MLAGGDDVPARTPCRHSEDLHETKLYINAQKLTSETFYKCSLTEHTTNYLIPKTQLQSTINVHDDTYTYMYSVVSMSDYSQHCLSSWSLIQVASVTIILP